MDATHGLFSARCTLGQTSGAAFSFLSLRNKCGVNDDVNFLLNRFPLYLNKCLGCKHTTTRRQRTVFLMQIDCSAGSQRKLAQPPNVVIGRNLSVTADGMLCLQNNSSLNEAAKQTKFLNLWRILQSAFLALCASADLMYLQNTDRARLPGKEAMTG